MKALFIGGTGIISTAVVRRLIEGSDWEVWLIQKSVRRTIRSLMRGATG